MSDIGAHLDDDALAQVVSFCDAYALSRFPRVSRRIAAALQPRLELLWQRMVQQRCRALDRPLVRTMRPGAVAVVTCKDEVTPASSAPSGYDSWRAAHEALTSSGLESASWSRELLQQRLEWAASLPKHGTHQYGFDLTFLNFSKDHADIHAVVPLWFDGALRFFWMSFIMWMGDDDDDDDDDDGEEFYGLDFQCSVSSEQPFSRMLSLTVDLDLEGEPFRFSVECATTERSICDMHSVTKLSMKQAETESSALQALTPRLFGASGLDEIIAHGSPSDEFESTPVPCVLNIAYASEEADPKHQAHAGYLPVGLFPRSHPKAPQELRVGESLLMPLGPGSDGLSPDVGNVLQDLDTWLSPADFDEIAGGPAETLNTMSKGEVHEIMARLMERVALRKAEAGVA